MRTTLLSSRRAKALLGLFAAATAVLFGAPGAHAEPTLVSSSPAADEQLATSPAELRLTFSETVSPETTVTVACNGAPAPVSTPRLEDDSVTVVVPVVGTITKSKCNVVWVAPLGGGETAQGTYSFDVLADAAPADSTQPPDTTATTEPPTTDGSTASTPSEPPRVGGVLGLVRIVAYVMLLGLLGAMFLIAFHWPEGVEYLVTLRYLRSIWIAGFVATILQVALATAQLGEHSVMSSLSPAAWGDLWSTTPGKALLLRMLLVAATGWVAIRPENLLDPARRNLALALPTLVIVTFGLSRSGGDAGLIGMASGVVHALAAAIWFGGLMLLARVVLLGPGDEDLVHAVRGYVRYSMPALIVTVASGAVQTYRLDNGALLSSGHGRLLLLKVAGVAAMAYIALAARPVMTQRLAHADHLDGRTASGLRRAVSTEWMIGIVVLALTSWMMSTQPAGLEASGSVNYEFDSQRSGGDLDVRVLLTSTDVGRSGVRVEVFAPQEGLADLRVTFRPPAGSNASGFRLEIPLTGAGAAELPQRDGVPFSVPGEWTIQIDADGPDGRLDPVLDNVTIEGDAASDTEVPSSTEAPDTTGG